MSLQLPSSYFSPFTFLSTLIPALDPPSLPSDMTVDVLSVPPNPLSEFDVDPVPISALFPDPSSPSPRLLFPSASPSLSLSSSADSLPFASLHEATSSTMTAASSSPQPHDLQRAGEGPAAAAADDAVCLSSDDDVEVIRATIKRRRLGLSELRQRRRRLREAQHAQQQQQQQTSDGASAEGRNAAVSQLDTESDDDSAVQRRLEAREEEKRGNPLAHTLPTLLLPAHAAARATTCSVCAACRLRGAEAAASPASETEVVDLTAEGHSLLEHPSLRARAAGSLGLRLPALSISQLPPRPPSPSTPPPKNTCPICQCELKEAAATRCGHVYC